jgi:glutamine cyclotransferase
LVEQEPRGVLNGIAKMGDRVFVTGKRWSSIYEVRFEPASLTRTPD